MIKAVRTLKTLLLIGVLSTTAAASTTGSSVLPEFIQNQERALSQLFVDHPFVALPAQSLFSPDPNQLRVQDLRGVDCYPQPDLLEVCGAADTSCILVFTKSEEIIPEIALTIRFNEGLEYGGFVTIPTSADAAYESADTDLDVISDQNPESPSFLISGVSQDSGAVVICFGVRAECGVDLEANPPNIAFEWEYTTEDGVFCQDEFMPPNPFSGNVITPRVQFTQTNNFPNTVNLGNVDNTTACQSVRLTETTPGASVTGYIVTVDDYGFEDGLEIIRVETPDGFILPADFDVDPTTGLMTVAIDRSDDPLGFNEVEEISVCFQYSACIPNVDYNPIYTVVSACEGVVCTGPPVAVSNGALASNFPGPADVQITYEEVQPPSIPGDQPFIFDIVFGTLGDDDITDDIFNLRARVRACASPLVYAAQVQLIDTDGTTVLGTLDGSALTIRTTDAGADLAGTLDIRLANNSTLSGGGLVDLDGDGKFDDVAAGDQVRLRVIYDINCSDEDASNVVSPAAGQNTGCIFTQIVANGNSGCGFVGESDAENIGNGPNLTTNSTATFSNEEMDIERNLDGYNFGFIGIPGNGSAGPTTVPFNVSYTLADDPITQCADPATGDIILQFIGIGDPRLTEDFVFDNFSLNGAPVDASNGTVEYPNEGTVLFTLTLPGGAGMADNVASFDITADTAYCSPRQIVIANVLVTKVCPEGGCDLTLASTSTNLRIDPENNDCSCYIEQYAEARRISRGFTDTTRTTRVDDIQFADDDARRVLPGDTVEVVGRYYIKPEAATSSRYASEFAVVDRTLSFEIEFDPSDVFNFNNSNKYESVINYSASRLQSIIHDRGGTRTNIGEEFSGGTQQLSSTGILIGNGASGQTNNFWYAPGEIEHPGFPNGGYQFQTGDNTNDDNRDGLRLRVEFRGDPGNTGEFNAIERFNEVLGGGPALQPGDSVIVTWHVVIVDNPGLVPAGDPANPSPTIDLPISTRLNGSVFIVRANNVSSNFGEDGCPDIPTSIEFYQPLVTSESRIVYNDACEAEAKVVFRNTDDLPADWYADEFRPINGIEQLTMDFPYPYYFSGGATVEAFGAREVNIFADSSAMVDTATVAGSQAYLPTGTDGRLRFTDAEFADGVRGRGYANIDFGDDDVTTVGGTFPLIGVGGTNVGGGAGRDSLVFTLPLRRICGDEPIIPPAMTADYSYASKYLPDYETYPWVENRNPSRAAYWTQVTNNDGLPVAPDNGFNSAGNPTTFFQLYFPFTRLPDPDDDNNEINPHRRVGLTTTYTAVNQPAPLSATLGASPGGDLLDADGPETQTITITPDAGQTLAGTIAISIGTGGTITDVTSGGASLILDQAAVTDSTTVFALPIPSTLGPDEAFVFDLSTDLLFCEAVEICIFPILGCADDPSLAAAAYAAFDPTCQTLALCYEYLAGAASIGTLFSEPETLELCAEQTLDVQYFNDGSSTVANFSPVLYIPEGLVVSNFTFSRTGGATGPLSDPTPTPSTDLVFGTGTVFTQAEIDAALGGDGFNPGEVLTISYTAATSCEFTSGLPLVTTVRGSNACGGEYDSPITLSSNINVALPGAQPLTTYDLGADNSPLQLSCSDNGEVLLLTIANVGKSDAVDAEIALRLPAGIDVNFDDINAIAPSGFIFDAASVVTTPINGSGDQQLRFPAPELPSGSFVCLEIPFIVGDVECGEYFVGATLLTFVEVTCSTTGEVCTIPVSTSQDLYFPIEVVAPVTANDASLSAACTATPGVFDVEYSYDFLAESQNFNGTVSISLFSDVDANGELDRTIDMQVGAPQNIAVSLIKDESQNFSGTFTGVDQAEICPLLLVIESDGCTCGEAVLPFPEVLPDFIFDLGDAVALCPGETFTFEGICANLDYAFDPPIAGTVVVDDATGEATISLNPGFGVDFRIPLIISGAFGSCGLEKEIGVTTVPDLDFGPYEYAVCNVGSQEVDLNIPLVLQEDITVNILNPVNIENPNSVEPRIRNLQQDMTYTVEFTFNDGQCAGSSQLSVTVEEAIEITLNDLTGCATGFNLSDQVNIEPLNTTGEFQTLGDGTFTNGGIFPGDIDYIPGPMDRENGFVNLRFNTDNPEGPCGPSSERIVATIQIVDCGSFFWDGSQD